MQFDAPITRQFAACPFTPVNVRVKPVPWSPATGYAGPAPTTCPGFTTSLPEVVETARGWVHWSKGQLDQFVGPGGATDELLQRIEMLDGAIAEQTSAELSAARGGR